MMLPTARPSGFAAYLTLVVMLAIPAVPKAAVSEVADTVQPRTDIKPAVQVPVQPAKAAPAKSKKKKKPKVPPPPPPPPPSPEPLAEIIGVADAPRDYLAEKFIGFVNSVDRFFGDDRNFQESNDSVLQFDITRVTGYGGERRLVLSGRAKARLPNTERKLHILIESDPDKNVSSDAARNQPVQPRAKSTPDSYGAGVRYEKTEEDRWHYSTDVGLKFQGLSTAPFARTRVSYALPLEEWQLKAVETLFWFNTIGAGESTQLDIERTYSPTLMFRSTSNATWLHDNQYFDLRQDLTFFHTLGDRRALLYQASAIGVSRPNAHVDDYVLLLIYRYRLHRKWMYVELSPQVHFPKERNFKSSGAVGFRLEILFDGSK